MSFMQTKTVWGSVPCDGVRFRPSCCGGGDGPPVASFLFDLVPATKLDRSRRCRDAGPGSQDDSIDLVDLGTCLDLENGKLQPNVCRLFELAQRVGPLFGGDDIESVRSWSHAAYAALLACRVQECLNKRKPVGALRAFGAIGKRVVERSSGGMAFSMLDVAVRTPGEYEGAFGRLPVVRRTVLEGAYEYSFALRTVGDDGEAYVEFIVVNLDHELTAGECSYLFGLLDVDAHTKAELREKTVVDDDSPAWDDYVMLSDGKGLTDLDAPSLEALIQVMIVAHLGSVQVDVFQGNQETGYLSFDSYISWLWYKFSRSLSAVTLGYCATCGKAFSLVGHRGIDRRYCCEACKTKAKNYRTAHRRDQIRRLFVDEQLSVGEIARRTGGSGAAAEGEVRRCLSTWVVLKHMLSDDLKDREFASSSLFRRCVDEGLDMDCLLNARLRHRLEECTRKNTLS